MILYVCPECGYWQDCSLGEYLANAFKPMFEAFSNGKISELAPTVYPCPDGHGALVLVKATDRLIVMALTPNLTLVPTNDSLEGEIHE